MNKSKQKCPLPYYIILGLKAEYCWSYDGIEISLLDSSQLRSIATEFSEIL